MSKNPFESKIHKPNFQVTAEEDGKKYWVTRSCAVLAIVLSKDKSGDWCILINKRGPGCPNFRGKWNIPCGFIDWGETYEQAASREVWEECGISISPGYFNLYAVMSDPGDLEETPTQNITIRTIAILDSKYMSIPTTSIYSEENEVEDIRWIRLSDMNSYEWAFNHRKLMAELSQKFPPKDTFSSWIDVQPDYGLCNPPMTAEEFERFIEKYLLSDGYMCTGMASTVSQCRPEILFDILKKYSRRFRKEWKQYKKYGNVK